MTDHTSAAAGSADEPTARQPAVPQPAEPPASEPAASPEPVAGAASAPPPPPQAYPPAAAAPPRRPWRDRRVPLLAVVGALLVGCLCGGGTVAAVGIIARVADHHGDSVRIVGRDGREMGPGVRPGERWRGDGPRRNQVNPPGPAETFPAPATPPTPVPTTSS